MGLLADAVRAVMPRPRGQAASATISTPVGLDLGRTTPGGFYAYAREGYSQNELVFACVEERVTSVAKAKFQAVQVTPKGEEVVEDHPAIALLERPNPWLSRYDLLANIEMFLCIAGNAYVERVRGGGGQTVELWLMRPDRVEVVPDPRRYVGGYRYQLGPDTFLLPPGDVMHIKNRNPLSEFYGLPLLAPVAARVDTDNWMRRFTAAFFQNAGVPAGLLNVMRTLQWDEKEIIRNRFRGDYGGPAGWHSLLLVDGGEADYKPMGMPLGERGLVLPDLEDVNESRIAMAFGVPLSIIGARLGYESGSYANRRSDREEYTQETILPELERIGDILTTLLLPEFGGADLIRYDPTSVPALLEDETLRQTRVLDKLKNGLITVQEARMEMGIPAEPETPGVFLVPSSLVPTPSEVYLNPEPPAPVPAALADQAAADQADGEPPPQEDMAATAMVELEELLRRTPVNGHGPG